MSSKIGTKSARIVSFPFESHSLSQKDRCSGGFADQTRASPRHVKFPLMASGLIEANWKSISTHGPPRGLVRYNSATMTNGLSKHANATVHEPRINKRVVRARVFIRISIVAFVDSNRVWRGEGGGGEWRACAHQWKMGRNENSGNGVTVMNLWKLHCRRVSIPPRLV